MHSVAMPTASAAMMTRARSTRDWRPPLMTCAGAPSSFTRAVRRVGSRLPGTSTVTPPPEVSTTMASSPAGRTRIWARPPPRTAFAVPAALPPDTVMSDVSAMPPKADPSAKRATSRDATSSEAAALMTALAMTVGTKGPGATARPSSSTTTTSSGRPNPEPPYCSGRCRPSQPSSAMSSQNEGRDSTSDSSRSRAAPRESCLARKSEAVCPRARWSSLIAIDMSK